MRLTCPGKIFVLGEYACLDKYPALLMTVGPRFSLNITATLENTPLIHPFAEHSPAGEYLNTHRHLLSGHRLEWHDPYDTPIGVGSSSAQFILCASWLNAKKSLPRLEAKTLLQMYWDTVGSSQGIRPSGIDVVAQYLGGPSVICNDPFSAEKIRPWSDPKTTLFLAFSGNKAKTHEHLKSLSERKFPEQFTSLTKQLSLLTLDGVKAWQDTRPKELGQILNAYQDELTQAKFAPSDFSNSIKNIQSIEGVLGCKGTGAQGGDCALVLANSDKLDVVFETLTKMNWKPISLDPSVEGLSFS